MVICQIISAIGIGIANTRIKPLLLRICFPILQIRLDKNRIMPSFATSATCREIGPM